MNGKLHVKRKTYVNKSIDRVDKKAETGLRPVSAK
jgi:hypothetical protein